MAKKQKHEVEVIGEKVKHEINALSEQVADKLFARQTPDSVQLTKQQYIQYVRDQWGDKQFRQTMLDRIGPEAFIALAKQVLSQPVPPTMSPQQIQIAMYGTGEEMNG